MKWPKRLHVFRHGHEHDRFSVCTCGHPETHDERIYVLVAPKRKAKKKPGTGGGSK